MKDKVQKALSEVRNLILGAQILLGFQYQAVLRPAFDSLPRYAKALEVVTLVMLLVTTACLMAPSSFHRISEKGEATRRQHEFAKLMITVALVPFALALGTNVVIATNGFLGTWLSVAVGCLASLMALLLWFGVPLMRRAKDGDRMQSDDADEKVPLKEKINELLTESRIVLPGAQALLGFQFAAYLTESFEKLPQSAKVVHTISLLCMALAMVLLMAPAPFHRIAENGENTERFDKLGVRLMLAALIPLSFGLGGELFVVLKKISGSTAMAVAGAVATIAGSLLLWFGVPLLARSRRARSLSAAQTQ